MAAGTRLRDRLVAARRGHRAGDGAGRLETAPGRGAAEGADARNSIPTVPLFCYNPLELPEKISPMVLFIAAAAFGIAYLVDVWIAEAHHRAIAKARYRAAVEANYRAVLERRVEAIKPS